jgi:hypothetical protein
MSTYDSLDGGSAHRKADTYAEQPQNRMNACLERYSNQNRSVCGREDISCLKPIGHFDRQGFWITKVLLWMYHKSRHSAVGIATGCGLDDRGVGVRVLVGSRIFSSPRRPDRLWSPPNLLSNGYPGGKAAEAWSWPLTSNYCRGQENVDLYIHTPIHLHGVVLN